jgi:hypothetical protein
MNVFTPRILLRIEGAAVFAAALAAYVLVLDGPLWLLVVLALAPDLAMAGYLAGPRVGAATYNAAHNYLPPLALAAVGLWLGSDPALWGAAIWVGHVGADRAVGYGLKYATGFGDTHLGRRSAPDPIEPVVTDDRA